MARITLERLQDPGHESSVSSGSVLLTYCRYSGNLEVHSPIVVRFMGGRQIEIGERDFVGAASSEVKKGIAHYRVVEHLRPVAVFENEHSRGLRSDRHWRFCRRSRVAGDWLTVSRSSRCHIPMRRSLHNVRVLRTGSIGVAGLIGRSAFRIVIGGVRRCVGNIDRFYHANSEISLIFVFVPASVVMAMGG